MFGRYTKSVILYRQMRGRGTRKARGKALFTMFDFVGVTDAHEDDDTYGERRMVVEPKPRPRPRPRALITVDIDDHIDPATREWVTVDENGNIVFPEPSEAKANELGARFEAWLLGREFTRDQERLLHWMESQIRVNADVLDEFTPDHPFSAARAGGARPRSCSGATRSSPR